jgi:hypothetical protein
MEPFGDAVNLSRGGRVLRGLLVAITCLCAVAFVAATTVRTTVLRTRFYVSIADRTNTFERFYDDVLVDPDVAELAVGLTSSQPDALAAAVGVNVRLVLPPDTLRQLVTDQIEEFLRWFGGRTESLQLQVSLAPVLANLEGSVAAYVSEVLAATPALRTTLPEFGRRLDVFVNDLRNGVRPSTVPSVNIDTQDRQAIEALLLEHIPPDVHGTVKPAIHAALLADNLGDALAAVGIDVAGIASAAGRSDVIRLARGEKWSLTRYVEQALGPREMDAVQTARWWVGTPLSMVFYGSIVVGLLALIALALLVEGTRRQRAISVAAGLGGGAVLAALVGLALWLWLADPVGSATMPSGWPQSVQRLLHDNVQATHAAVLRRWFVVTGAVAAGAAAVPLSVVAGTVWRRRPAVASGTRRAGRAATVVAPICLALVAAGLLIATPRSAPRCNGYAYLCQRRYDQVTALATHNAMASTQDGFLFPLQDVDIRTQLDAGARALQLDSWNWETPGQVTARLDGAGFSAAAVSAAASILAAANPPRPGVWLCHGVCRLGALPMVATLEQLRRWLDRNPREVVTIVLQDETPATQSVVAFERAGLVPYLAVPPADPSDPWPTLGDMIASGHRLVAFTENAHDAAPWLQNFYSYGEETPFAFSSVRAMDTDSGCAPHRGGTDGSLFLLNHFITIASGSRAASARVNSAQFLTGRVRRCAGLRGRLPTIVAVDFATLGDAQAVVDDLNRSG